MYLRCEKCGAPVISHADLLDRIKAEWDAELRKRRHTHGPERTEIESKIAQCRTCYKSLAHLMGTREYAQAVAPARYRVMKEYVMKYGLITAEGVQKLEDTADSIARANLAAEDKAIARIYGDFDTICNRGRPDPTADAVLRRLK